MKRLLTAAAIALAAGLAACATATPYQPATFTARGPQNGFYEQPLEGNRWRVGFAGNTVTGREQVEDALLLRAAELTLQQGFDHFLAVNRATERDVRYQADPTFPSARYGYPYSRFGYSHWSPYWRYYRPTFGWSRWDPFYSDPFLDRDYTIREIDKYEATAEIVMGRGAPSGGDPRAFDARQIVANLGPRIPRPQYQQGYGPGYAPAPMAPGYQQPGGYRTPGYQTPGYRTPAYPAPAPSYPRRY